MKRFKEKLIVGIDHGYGNIKTANHCFKTGIMGYDAEPLFTKDMLEYGGRYYLIGEGHKEFLPDKIKDEDYYFLSLVAIAEELKDKGPTEADVIIAAGLPLTWTSGQKNEFAAYLSKNEEISFTYQHTASRPYLRRKNLSARLCRSFGVRYHDERAFRCGGYRQRDDEHAVPHKRQTDEQ